MRGLGFAVSPWPRQRRQRARDPALRREHAARTLLAAILIAGAVGWVVGDTIAGGRVFGVRRHVDAITGGLVTDLRVFDGDTFWLDGELIRLWGIDAPQLPQRCDGVAIGEAAKGHLAALIGYGAPSCTAVRTDRIGRTVARCMAAGEDLSRQMVAEGWAWDYARVSGGAYAAAEAQAREQRLGIWALATCEPPWEWRARQ